jgi:CspA family cold shock protein
MSTDTVTSSALESFIGRVKWFNNKAGYGFITVTDGSKTGSDIFVHHSAINVADQQYKYLVQGEYVQFSLLATQGGVHEFQASCVCGVNSGKLMCETRNENKSTKKNYKTTTTTDVDEPEQIKPVKEVSESKTPRTRGEGPRDAEKGNWKVVSEKTTKEVSSKPRGRGRPTRSVSENI